MLFRTALRERAKYLSNDMLQALPCGLIRNVFFWDIRLSKACDCFFP